MNTNICFRFRNDLIKVVQSHSLFALNNIVQKLQGYTVYLLKYTQQIVNKYNSAIKLKKHETANRNNIINKLKQCYIRYLYDKHAPNMSTNSVSPGIYN